ncbi:uncharacterized protein LOC131955938 [Physella acuta]|uniref:uncharacterized protein LOC131955938 n=1 Tax=Physella acuta TaxID=109671 RepID=UPI0027DDDEB0|nr:uncharacterized protein LOC131955938 [Physella acuta]
MSPIPTEQAGTYEVEVCEQGEADLHKHYSGCKKNPGHAQFLPLHSLSTKFLPERYANEEILNLINILAKLTVMLKVKYTSHTRPEFTHGTDIPYPFYKLRGSDVLRIGTGTILGVSNDNTLADTVCSCSECTESEAPKYSWGKLHVLTATHLVFNDDEALKTSCVYGFNSSCSEQATLKGLKILRKNIEEDSCILLCVTHDTEFVENVRKIVNEFDKLSKELHKRYLEYRNVDKLALIVSHPHGCPKQLSVGQWIQKVQHSADKTRYTYTTCTCPGSSGALVYTLGWWNWCFDHVHSGCNGEVNYSSVGLDKT